MESRMKTRYTAIVVLGAIGLQSATVPVDARTRKTRSEARVEQARGTLPRGAKIESPPKTAKSTPEGGPAPSATNSPSIPVTCNQQNASLPACYSATQQARPVAR